MKDILLVSFKYPPAYSGYGMQLKSVTEKITSIDETYRFTVVTAYKMSQNTGNKNINVIPLLNKEKVNNKDIYFFSLKLFIWLIFNIKNYIVIHCVKAGPEAIICNIISKIFRKPLVVKIVQSEFSARELNLTSGIHRLLTILKQKILTSVDYFIAISEEIEENIYNHIHRYEKIIKIPNGVETYGKFYPVKSDEKNIIRKKLIINKNDIVILYVGSINKRKGIFDLLNSLTYIKTDKSVKLILCGPVTEKKREFFEKINLINSKSKILVEYKGEVSNPNEYMQASDIFILPSYSEGLPNVLLEAGATGLPLITTDIGGSRDIVINDLNGYIVNLEAPGEIGDKLTVLIENEELRERLGKNSREHVKNKFSLDLVANSYIELYSYMMN